MNEAKPKRHAVVRRLWQETPRLVGAILDVDADVAASHQKPGQYVVLHRAPDVKLFMAIASAPGDSGSLELLLGEAAQAKLTLKERDRIELDPPQGKGFAVDHGKGKDIFLFAVGSGMSAIRSMVEDIRKRRKDFGEVYLFVGAKSLDEHPYRAFEKNWEADGIRIVRSISRPWVQERFMENNLKVDNAVAYLCGTKEMVQGVTETLTRVGMPKDRIFLNF